MTARGRAHSEDACGGGRARHLRGRGQCGRPVAVGGEHADSGARAASGDRALRPLAASAHAQRQGHGAAADRAQDHRPARQPARRRRLARRVRRPAAPRRHPHRSVELRAGGARRPDANLPAAGGADRHRHEHAAVQAAQRRRAGRRHHRRAAEPAGRPAVSALRAGGDLRDRAARRCRRKRRGTAAPLSLHQAGARRLAAAHDRRADRQDGGVAAHDHAARTRSRR